MRLAAGLLVTLIVVTLSGGQAGAAPEGPEIAYTDFKALIEQGKIEEIVLQGGEMRGKLRAPAPLGPRGEPETKESLVVKVEVPGMDQKDIEGLRSVRLPVAVDAGKVAATFKNGAVDGDPGQDTGGEGHDDPDQGRIAGTDGR